VTLRYQITSLNIFADLISPLPAVQTAIEPAEPSAPQPLATPIVETYDDRRELRKIMYEYIQFVQHSKDQVKVDPADIAALTPSKSLPGVTLAIKRKNGRFLKVCQQLYVFM